MIGHDESAAMCYTCRTFVCDTHDQSAESISFQFRKCSDEECAGDSAYITCNQCPCSMSPVAFFTFVPLTLSSEFKDILSLDFMRHSHTSFSYNVPQKVLYDLVARSYRRLPVKEVRQDAPQLQIAAGQGKTCFRCKNGGSLHLVPCSSLHQRMTFG
jgi:hypothetical protein